MTDQEINDRMAELHGWKAHPRFHDNIIAPDGTHWERSVIPRYLYDLNAVAQVEEKLTEEQWKQYVDLLASANGNAPHPNWYTEARAAVSATARQRCAALLKVHGKWRD